MASSKSLLCPNKCASMPLLPTTMSEVKIVLLGKKVPLTNRVGNFILGRAAFETEDHLCSVKLHSERASGHVEGRLITIINTPHLYNPQLSQEELTQRIKECISLAGSGPHVFLLVLQSELIIHDPMDKVRSILETYNPLSRKLSIVLTTGDDHGFISECEVRHHRIKNIYTYNKHEVLQLLEKIDAVVRENRHQDHLTGLKPKTDRDTVSENLEENKDPGDPAVRPKVPQQACSSWYKPFEKMKSRGMKLIKRQQSEPKQTKHWNLVLLGINLVKTSISNVLLGENASLVHTESTLLCVQQGEMCGHMITLVEMPAFYNIHLSEQELMHEALHCVSVCDSGVHAFFITVPEGPLTDEDKAEIKMIRRIFSSSVNDHIIFIINQQSQKEELDKDLQSVINEYGGKYLFYSSKTSPKKLFSSVKNLLKQNCNRQYTVTMYSDAQIETQLQYKREIEKLQKQMTELKKSNIHQSQDLLKNLDTLRIVLLGKTGVGKSASGNTIVGRKVFTELVSAKSVTTMCQKETSEVSGRHITVIDTPGLFDTNTDKDKTKKEIIKCISLAAPGPHVFLLVLSLTQRFTKEEREAVKFIEEMFGKKSSIYTIILFTGGDVLKDQTIEQYMEDAGADLNTLLHTCGKRYHVLNNNDKSSNTQVLRLLDKIHSMVKVNGGNCYTNEMFQLAEEVLEQEKERILKEKEKQIEREKEQLKAKHEAEMEKMRTEMQKQKERQEKEARRKEEEFKEKEVEIKREMSKREKQLREYFRKRKEDDDLNMKKLMRQIDTEREENRKQWERQKEEQREQEEKERKRKEEEWKEKQKEETKRFKREKEEMKMNKEEELKKLKKEYEQKAAEQDRRKRELEEKIKDAEESKKKELQALQLSQQQEWERWRRRDEEMAKKQQMDWEKRIASVEERWSVEQVRKQKQYEEERKKEKKVGDLREKERKEKEEQERKIIENEYRDRIRQMEEQIKLQREQDEIERKKKDEERKMEMEVKLRKQQNDFRKEKEDEDRKLTEEKERNIAYIKEQHNTELEILKRETEEEARKQAEEEYLAQLDEKLEAAKREGFKEGCDEIQSERTIPGRAVDSFINKCFSRWQTEK